MNNVHLKNGNVLEEMRAGSNSDTVKTTLKGLRKLFGHGHCHVHTWPSTSCKFLKSFSPFLYHFVTTSREYYKWFSGLKHHIQIGKPQSSNFPCALRH